MQHVVNKSLTHRVAANLISSHLVHAGNHRHGSAGHNQGGRRAPKAADVYVVVDGGSYYTHRNWSSTGVLSLSWHRPSRPRCLHKSGHRP